MAFGLKKTKKEGTLSVEGALTVSRIAEVREELLAAFKSSAKVVLDLTAVTEVDLSALQLCCSAHKTAVKKGKVFELTDSSVGVVRNTAGMNGYLRQQGCSIDQDETCLWNTKKRSA